MKKCHQCGTPWTGFGSGPRAREICDGCGAYLHCCVNCHHFDQQTSCRLRDSSFIGPRTALNYCEFFKMSDTVLREAEARVTRARDRWEALFGR
ncbi:MAG: hypothetical protein JXA90_15135 [Planctomycetes bacterium]|nr:hypothetical protein [Planctomycetota bacterium]